MLKVAGSLILFFFHFSLFFFNKLFKKTFAYYKHETEIKENNKIKKAKTEKKLTNLFQKRTSLINW